MRLIRDSTFFLLCTLLALLPRTGFAVTAIPSNSALTTAISQCLAEDPVGGICTSYGASSTYGTMPNWDTTNITSLVNAFKDKTTFNGDISAWNTSSVTNMTGVFNNARSFNQDISRWVTSSVTNMSDMFHNAWSFNQDISGWNITNVTLLARTFRFAKVFNQDISGWDTSNVTSFYGLFIDARAFNQPIGAWATNNVTNFAYAFYNATAFNQDIGAWRTSQVTTMQNMFYGATAFLQSSIRTWNTASVSNYAGMFINASAMGNAYNGVTGYGTTPTSSFFNQSISVIITAANGSGAVASGSTSSDSALTLTFTASGTTSDFTAADVTVSGATLSNFTGSGTSYTATLSATSASVTVDVGANKFTSNSLNNVASAQFTWTTSTDLTAPTLSAAAVSASGTSLVITASEALDATSVPAATSFTVTSDGVTVPVTGVAVSGSQTTLTLGQTVGTGQSVSVAYTAPGSNPLKDAAGNLLASFGASSTTNSSTQVLQLPSPLTKTAVVEGVKAQEKITSRASNFAMASVSNRLDWIRVNPGVSQRSYQGIKLRLANPMLDAIINGNYNQNSLGMDDLFEVGKQVASGAKETALLKNKVNAEILNQLAGIKSGLGLANLNANPTGDALVGKWSGWTYGEIIVGDNATDPTAITKIKAKNLAFGADRPTDKEGLIGFAVTLGNDEETVASNGSALDANLFSLEGYRPDQMDKGLALDSMLGYTRMKFDTTRLDGSQTLTGKRLGDQLFAEVALRPVQHSEAALKLTPFGKTSIVYSSLRAYTEQGGSYALFYGKQEQSMATVAIGVDVSYETYYAGARLLPSLGLEYGSSKKFGKGGAVRYVSETTVYLLDPDQAKTESVQLRLGMDYLKKNGQSLNVMLRRTLQTDHTRLTALRVMYTVPLN